MTQLNISLEEAKKLSEYAIDFIAKFGPSSKVMGGFVRDAAFGRPVKDMDVYIDTPNTWKEEQMDALAKAFFEDRGHEYIRHDKKVVEGVTEQEALQYSRALWVYSSVDVAEGDFPVDLIFPPSGWAHPGMFDLALCQCRIQKGTYEGPLDGRGRRTWLEGIHHKVSVEAQNDFDNKQITINRLDDVIMEELRGFREMTEEEFESSYKRLLGHILRVKDKYPDFRVCVNPEHMRNIPEMSEMYRRLKEDGIFGEAREILQAQGEGVTWDEVRLIDRETATRIVDETRRAQEELGVQAAIRAIHGRAQLQPGLQLEGSGAAFTWETPHRDLFGGYTITNRG